MLPATGFLMALFWGAVVLLVLAAFARVRRRLGGGDAPTGGGAGLRDDDIRAIEATGFLAVDEPEPLDLDAIEEEERRFWDEEEWDQAEEW